MSKDIRHFDGEHRFLSNFYPCRVKYAGVIWPTVEHAFQAAKTQDPIERLEILNAPSPGEAKKLGRAVALRPDWDALKVPLMKILLASKFTLTERLGVQLIGTGDVQLIEGNTWHDNFWGDCYCRSCADKIGHNNLGKLLMRLREIMTEAVRSGESFSRQLSSMRQLLSMGDK